jgi:hypothetical protein
VLHYGIWCSRSGLGNYSPCTQHHLSSRYAGHGRAKMLAPCYRSWCHTERTSRWPKSFARKETTLPVAQSRELLYEAHVCLDISLSLLMQMYLESSRGLDFTRDYIKKRRDRVNQIVMLSGLGLGLVIICIQVPKCN